jgi:lysine-N-methylase
MTIPIRNLPLVQNWDCHSCSDCCRIEAPVSIEEKDRIEALDLGDDPEIGPRPWFVSKSWWSRSWTLRRRPDGRCVFLTSANRCRLHERFGPEAKPLACRLFPFVFIPTGDHWRVSLRFSCPSAAANKGRPLNEHASALTKLAQGLEKQWGPLIEKVPPPYLQYRQQVPWPDLLRFLATLIDMVQDRGDRLERRLRKCLALARGCRQARFENVSGGRLTEFLHLLRTSLDVEVPQTPEEVPPPSRLGRLLFRTLLAIFARKDVGLHRGPATRTALARLLSGWRFVRGRGRVPLVNGFLSETTFAEVECRRTRSGELDQSLERYYLVKLNSLQFCGRANFDLPFWTGLESLIATLPMILWLTRALGHLPPQAAVEKAIYLVDDHFAANPVLALRHNRFFLNALADRGELERLIAWYAR